MVELGLGTGVSEVDFGFIKRAGKKLGRATWRGVYAAGRGVKKGAQAAGRGVKKGAKRVKKGAKGLAKKAVAYSPDILAAAVGKGASALCQAYGIPGPLCEKGGQALGREIGKKLAKATGIPTKNLPVDPTAVMNGDPKALMVLGRTLAAEAGLPLPSKDDAIAFAAKRLKLPPALTKSAIMQAENAMARQQSGSMMKGYR